MNCKPGDLAIILRSDGYGLPGRISKMSVNKIVRVTHLRSPSNDFHCMVDQVWNFEESIKIVLDGRTFIVDGCADYCLSPIRPDESPEQSLEAMRDLMQTKREKVTT